MSELVARLEAEAEALAHERSALKLRAAQAAEALAHAEKLAEDAQVID